MDLCGVGGGELCDFGCEGEGSLDDGVWVVGVAVGVGICEGGEDGAG